MHALTLAPEPLGVYMLGTMNVFELEEANRLDKNAQIPQTSFQLMLFQFLKVLGLESNLAFGMDDYSK